jgi:hypothetical protein
VGGIGVADAPRDLRMHGGGGSGFDSGRGGGGGDGSARRRVQREREGGSERRSETVSLEDPLDVVCLSVFFGHFVSLCRSISSLFVFALVRLFLSLLSLPLPHHPPLLSRSLALLLSEL